MDWNAALGRSLPRFLPRGYSSRYETVNGALSDTFAAVAAEVFRAFDHDDGWPSYANGDLSSAYIRNPLETALVLQVERKVLVVLCSGLAETIVDYCAAAGLLAGSRLPDDWTGDAEHLDDWPSLAAAWASHGLSTREQRYAHGILLSALDFLALHEVAHLELGHLEEIAATEHRLFGEGEVAARLSRLSRRDLQYREFEADLWAFQQCLERWVERGLATDAADLLGPVSLAWMLTLMALDSGIPLAKQAAKRHPPPVYRAVFLDEVFMEGTSTAFGTNQVEIRHLLDSTWRHMSEIAKSSGKVRHRWWGDSNARMGLSSYPRVRNGFARYYSEKLDCGRLPRQPLGG